ncbi:MAG: homoserine kinase [Christensenellales bacterium]|jgi:homoserine kinase
MIRVHVPAGTTNLGAGFDCLGLALAISNTIAVGESDALRIEVPQEEEGRIPQDERNLVWQAMVRTWEAAGVAVRPVSIRQVNRIPVTRGLGSSAAAIVSGIVAADRLASLRMSIEDRLDLAARLDGHPDNVAPALLGGLTAVALDGGRVRAVRAMPHPGFSFFIMIPDFELSTRRARTALPDQYSRADAVHNLTRATLMFASLTGGHPENLWTSCDDRMHQPYRRALVPGFDEILAAARRHGAAGAWLSGAGPAIAAAVWGDTADFEAGMRGALAALPGRWSLHLPGVAAEGAVAEPSDI